MRARDIRDTRAARTLANPFVHATLALACLAAWTSVQGFASYDTYVAQLVCIYAIAVLGLNIPGGFGGALSLGQGASFALGAYTTAILASKEAWPFWATLPLSLLVGLAFGLALGAPAGRLGVIGLAMVSLGSGLVLTDLIVGLDGLTGGAAGLPNVLALGSFGSDGLGGLATAEWLVTALVLGSAYVVYLLHWRYRMSARGRALMAVRDNDLGAPTIGVSPYRERVLAFGVGSAFGALAGGLFAYQSLYVTPESLTANLSILLLAMMVLGGAASRLGPVVGATILGILPLSLDQWPHVNVLVYGALLILIPLLRPRGILARTAVAVYVERPSAAGRAPALDPASTGPVLRACGLTRSFGGVKAVDGVDLEVGAGEVVAVIGPNGSGKTTLLNLLSGFYRPDAGSVALGGDDVTGVPVSRAARLGISRTFQTPKVFGDLSVSEHMLLAHEHVVAGASPERREVARAAAAELLAAAGLDLARPGVAGREARTLSHGQVRFLEAAMAIERAPRLLLLDEPAAGLSADEIATLERVVSHVAERLGIAVIVVEHHLGLVRRLAGTVVVLDLGRVLWRGDPAQLERSDVVRDAYLGIGA
jgi:branched-chain amino acid transport system ATP-binding protein/branched-chain amino acid transport system permease protein